MYNLFYKYLAYFLFPLFSGVGALCLTKLCIKLMPIFGFIAIPGGRHIHARPTPKAGGLAVVIAFFITWLLLLHSPWNYFIGTLGKKMILVIGIHSALLLITGLIDDRFGIPALLKLLIQCLIAASCWFFGIRFQLLFGYELNIIFSLLITIFWIISFINAFNLIDGMDGLASGLAVISSLCMASYLAFQHYPLDTVVMLCLCAACLGFLKFNFYPAKIFLGDTGSMFLGFIFAVVGILSSAQSATISSVLIPILAAGLPFFDVFFAIWRRFTRKLLFKIEGEETRNGVIEADSDHIHHRLLTRHKDQRKTVLVLYSIAIILASISVLMQLLKNRAQGLAILLFLLIAVTITRRLATFEIWNSTKLIIHGIEEPKNNIYIAIAHPFYDLMVIIFSAFLSCFLFSNYRLSDVISKEYIKIIYISAPIVILLHVAKTYNRVWTKACSRDYLRLIETLILAHLVSTSINWGLCATKNIKLFWSFHMLFFFLSSSEIVAERMFIRYLRTSILRKSFFLSRFRPANIPSVVIYGAGLKCLFYLTRVHNNIEKEPVEIVGIIDDNPALWEQMVYGYKVLGDIKLLSETIKSKKLDKIVLACEIQEPQKEKLLNICAQNNIKLTTFFLAEKVLFGN